MEFYFNIFISYRKFSSYYQGYSDSVALTDVNGRHLQINAKYFRPFLTVNGIRGHFKLELDSKGAYKSLIKLE